MTKSDIISKLAKNSTVERMISKYTNGQADFASDLSQDIYVSLLEKDDTLITELYNNDQLGFFVLRMVRNNLFSTTSPYYSKYIKYSTKASDLSISEYKIPDDEKF